MSDFNSPEFAASQQAFANKLASEKAGNDYLKRLSAVVDEATRQLDLKQATIDQLKQELNITVAQKNMAEMLLAVSRETLEEVVDTDVVNGSRVKNVFARKFLEIKHRAIEAKVLFEADFIDTKILGRLPKNLKFLNKMRS